jgi:sugar phosphate isomerase/epimerase
MSEHSHSNFPKLHNAMWPGLVGKGSPGAEPSIDLDTMLDFTAKAEVDGIKFDGVDLFLYDPHISINIDDDGIKRLADKIARKGFVVGSVVAPVWFDGSAMGDETKRKNYLQSIHKACRIAKRLRDLGVRPYGIVRIDSAAGVEDWSKDPEANQRTIVETFGQACDIAEEFGERLAAEGEICWGGMHSWRKMVDLLERVNRPQTLGFQADMAHTLLYILGYNAPDDAILPADWDWSDPHRLDAALKTLTNALRPWTIDFHVAQNDATVKGSGTHDKTGHHCLPNDPNGKLSIAHHAGYWLHDEHGHLTKAFNHICWDGCMFPNAVMTRQETWNDILAAMISVRDAHGWREDDETEEAATEAAPIAVVKSSAKSPPKKPAAKKAAARKPAAKQKVARKAKQKSAKPVKKKAVRKITKKSAKRPAKKSQKRHARKPTKRLAAKKRGKRK